MGAAGLRLVREDVFQQKVHGVVFFCYESDVRRLAYLVRFDVPLNGINDQMPFDAKFRLKMKNK